MILYLLARAVFAVIFRLIFRIKISGIENIPENGAVIIASNHLSLWDPPIVGYAVPRPVNFMAKEELFTIPLFGLLIRRLKAFPVKRGSADRTAIRHAINILESGQVVGLFPEGTRSKKGSLGEFEPGIGLIAFKANAVVIPTAIINSNKIFSSDKFLPQLKVVFGNPIFVSPELGREAMEVFNTNLRSSIEQLLSSDQKV